MDDEAFPPKHRMTTSLPILRVEIVHADGVEVLDPNAAAVLAVMEPQTLLAWQPLPNRSSDLSAKPALLYRAEDLELALTPEELHRLLKLGLAREEYFALRGRYGMAFEWHDDFYDAETGDAIQPRVG